MPEIRGVEVFAVGKWNGDEYTIEDLQNMVDNFNDTKATIKPYVKLGHDENQKLVQKDGLPAAGWIEQVYIKGEKLVADFVDVPQKIYDLIVKKAYRKVSAEIFWNLRIKEKTYRRLLSAVSLLGADMPAVSTLNDILALYGLDAQDNNTEIKTYEINLQEAAMAEENDNKLEQLENELKAANEKAATTEEQLKKFQADMETLKKENDLLESYKKQAEEEKARLELEKEEAERKNFVLELEKQNLCSASMKPLLESLLSEEKKEYCISDKKYSKRDLVTEILKLHKAAQDVNFDENSQDGKEVKETEDDIIAKIEKYQAENNCTYAQAHKAVMKKPETETKE